jgi:class I fructose-bisphosphate aldolase
MDHGVTVGPIYGLVDLRDAVNQAAEGGANAVLMHKGVPRCSHRRHGRDIGLIMHLSASTDLSPYPNAKTLVGTVEDALKLGADGVSVHVNLGDETERHMLSELGKLTSSAAEWGMPVIAMMYARGPKVTDQYDPDVVAHCARVGMELGADIVKVNYTGDPKSFETVTRCCCIPVVIAGGPRMENDEQILRMAYDSVAAGGAGLSVGRNIFQHPDTSRLVRSLHAIVHNEAEVKDALEMMRS